MLACLHVVSHDFSGEFRFAGCWVIKKISVMYDFASVTIVRKPVSFAMLRDKPEKFFCSEDRGQILDLTR